MNILTIILLSRTSISPVYRIQLGAIGTVFHNIMTCRSFRLLRLSPLNHLDDVTTTSLATDSIVFARSQEYESDGHQAPRITEVLTSHSVSIGE